MSCLVFLGDVRSAAVAPVLVTAWRPQVRPAVDAGQADQGNGAEVAEPSSIYYEGGSLCESYKLV